MYVAPFRIQFQEEATEYGEKLTKETIEKMGVYVDSLCSLKIYHPQTDLFSDKKEDIHPMVVKQLALQLRVFDEVYRGLCKRLKQSNPDGGQNENVIGLDIFRHFATLGEPFNEKLKEICRGMSVDSNSMEEACAAKIEETVDKLYNPDMRMIDVLQTIAYQNALSKMFGGEYQEYYYSYYQFKTRAEEIKAVEVIETRDLLPIISQGGNLDRAARITNVVLKVLEVYAPEDMKILHPYNIFMYTENILKYYEDDYKTYIKVGQIILGVKLQRDIGGMCLSIKTIEGQLLNKKTKSLMKEREIIVRDTVTQSIETQLNEMLVELIETMNNLQGKRSKRHKSSGIQIV